MLKMYLKNKIFFSTVLFFFLQSIFVSSVFAEGTVSQKNESAAKTGVGFYVKAQIPSNQIDKSLTYFDLIVKPDSKQTIKVDIVNEEDKEIIIDVSTISASTNRNGLIDYRTPNIKDESLKNPFSEISKATEPSLTIPANSSITANIEVTMPKERYDGVILGGIVITRRIEIDENELKNQSSINNEYSYVIGVKLRETEKILKPTFEFFEVKAKTVDYRAAIVHFLRNKEAIIIKNLKVQINIKDKKTNEIILTHNQKIDMAPNSIIELSVYPTNGSLNPSDYTSEVVLTNEDEDFKFDKDFQINNEEINNIEENIPKPSSNFIYIIFGFCILLLIFILLLILFLIKRKREKENEEEFEEHTEKDYDNKKI